eukprot:TRINITY_DN8368_c0_g1_i3.p1 TRINITY_DN8368_c0_g1~~TRINITY_DN8368_c0_g1_i3.p1  ORF type:complete len:210 (-),score=64.04 TRINITY_DN8368_c0_g1_i3:16-645(-)
MVEKKENEEKMLGYLSIWFSTCVDYMSRIVCVLGEQLGVVIYYALLGRSIIINAEEETQNQMGCFLSSFSLSDPNKKAKQDEEPLVIEMSIGVLTGKCHVSAVKTNPFCMEWANQLLAIQSDATQIRQLIDDKKLQILNELNSINQKVNEAKFDHYALYRAYNELKSNPNQDVLLVLLLQDFDLDPHSKEVTQVIHNYITHTHTAPTHK